MNFYYLYIYILCVMYRQQSCNQRIFLSQCCDDNKGILLYLIFTISTWLMTPLFVYSSAVGCTASDAFISWNAANVSLI